MTSTLFLENELFEQLNNEVRELVSPADEWLQGILLYYHNLGGKRFRPALFFATLSCFTSDLSKYVPYASVIELMHTFSLYHDDVLDEASLRRGETSVNKKFGVHTSIIAGDILHGLIHGYLLNLSNKQQLEYAAVNKFLYDMISRVELPIGTAAIKEMEFAKSTSFPLFEESLKVTQNKTAPIFALSMAAGAYLSGQSSQIAEQLWQIGMDLGLVFQLYDDLLDIFGKNIGKAVGGDLKEQKKTPFTVLAYQKNPEILLSFFDKEKLSDEDIAFFQKEFMSEIQQISLLIQSKIAIINTTLTEISSNLPLDNLMQAILLVEEKVQQLLQIL